MYRFLFSLTSFIKVWMLAKVSRGMANRVKYKACLLMKVRTCFFGRSSVWSLNVWFFLWLAFCLGFSLSCCSVPRAKGAFGSLPIFQFLRSQNKNYFHREKANMDPFYATYPEPIPAIAPPWQYSQWLHCHCGIFPNPSLIFVWPALHDAHSHEATLPADFSVQWVS